MSKNQKRIKKDIEKIKELVYKFWGTSNLDLPDMIGYICLVYTERKNCFPEGRKERDKSISHLVFLRSRDYYKKENGRGQTKIIKKGICPLSKAYYVAEDRENVQKIDNKLDIKKAIEILGKREKYIIVERYYNGKLYKEIGKKLKLTPRRISQIATTAKKKMRKFLV